VLAKKASGRAVYDKFVNVWFMKSAIALCRQRYIRYVSLAASVVAPVPFVNRMTLSKSTILHRFPNFYTLGVFRSFFRSSLRMSSMNHKKFHGNWSAHFSKIRNTDRQTRQLRQTDTAALYVYRCLCYNFFRFIDACLLFALGLVA